MADTVFHADVSRVEHVIFLRSGRAAAPREPAPSAGVVPVVFTVVLIKGVVAASAPRGPLQAAPEGGHVARGAEEGGARGDDDAADE
eukprot:1907115-Rhodomonas_salina.1